MDIPYETFESLNVRGIKGNKKREEIFHWLKQRNTLFFLIVDTHCNQINLAKKWQKQWSNDERDSLWSLGTNKQKGVANLINPRLKKEGISYSSEMIDSNGKN